MFSSWLECLSVSDTEVLREECEVLFTAGEKADGSKYSSGQTLWVGSDSDPENLKWAVERFALQTFLAHTVGQAFDPKRSGVEFWPLVLESIDDVGAHYDKDYGAEDNDECFYPDWATVTYLGSTIGAPTIFMENTEDQPLPAEISRGYISKVVPGKHVRFSGKLLHCASSDVATLASERWLPSVRKSQARDRVTLLVNIWLDHIPEDPIPLPLDPPAHILASNYSNSFKLGAKESLSEVSCVAKEGVKVKMRLDGKRLLKFSIPIESIVDCKSSSVAINFGEGAAGVQVRAKKKKKDKKKKDKKNKEKKNKKKK